jgi:Flp pilus assembly protein TadD
MKRAGISRLLLLVACAAATLAASACAFKESGYGVGTQAEREATMQNAQHEPRPDTPGLYLALIDRMQTQGLYYASLAHIDAYEKQYGATPDSTLLRADALRATGQSDASAAGYRALLTTPLAARGYRGLGLLAGAAGDFADAGRQLDHAVELAPTDATTLSDLGYARLREGDVAGARVPLMKAAELDRHSAKILSNVALLLLAQGHPREALELMDEQQFSPEVRAAIRADAEEVAASERARSSARLLGRQERQAAPVPARPEAALADVQPTSSTARDMQTSPLPIPQHFAQ